MHNKILFRNIIILNLRNSVNDLFLKSNVFFYRLYVNWRFMRGIEAQFLALQKGFNELIPQHLLRPFDERELEVCKLIVYLDVR